MSLLACLLIVGVFSSRFAWGVQISSHPRLESLSQNLIDKGHYTRSELEQLFAQAEVSESVLKAMTSPAEFTMTWGRYRNIFLKPDRIQRGVDFWLEYQVEFDRAEREYGVPASIIAAIIGVESKYGRYKGAHKVLDSLVTLVTGYPRRSAFFADELEQFLILCKKNGFNASKLKGSYAGAMGFPQFISSSYRNYAIDFSGDGVVDLINQPVDAIGSIANYFIENGWQPGESVSSEPLLSLPKRVLALENRKRKTPYTASELRMAGAQIPDNISGEERLNVLMLDKNPTKIRKHSGFYVVRAGDTLCQVAQRLSVGCRKLWRLNQLDKQGRIFRGQKLKLPKSASTPTEEGGSEATPMPVYFYTHKNFYAITRYNQSVLYAMAVYDLSMALEKAKNDRQTVSEIGDVSQTQQGWQISSEKCV